MIGLPETDNGKPMRQEIMKSYYRYWGKADKESDRHHLLVYHCLDVAAVTAVWWKASPLVRRSFCDAAQCAEQTIRAWLLFFVALHDYGKFDLRFQLKVHSIWQAIYPLAGQGLALPSKADIFAYRHGESGLSWCKQDILALLGGTEQSDSLFLDEPAQWQALKTWIEAVTGHHGHIREAGSVVEPRLPFASDGRLAEVDRAARYAWLLELERFFLLPAGLSLSDSPPAPSPLLAGLCSVADWLASRCDEINFSFQQDHELLEEYFKRKVAEDARRVFAYSGIAGTVRSFGGVRALLPESATPRPLQGRVDQLPLAPGLTIIEAPTGSGKTEAALAYAWRLLTAGLADSLIFALPTQATANAMLGRLEKLAGKLFEDSPNLLLAHGSARFNKEFAQLKRRGLEDEGEPDGWAQCGAWLAESRKRVFLGQIGVCTVDQALISVLPVKHRFVRGFGLGRSVLIVDEVHAYDAYMYGLLEEVLRQQRLAGASAILLSATLPAGQKLHLCNAWQSGEGGNNDKVAPYPLISWAGASEAQSLALGDGEQPDPIEVQTETLRLDNLKPDEALLLRIIKAAESGAQVAVVCNLVGDAQQVAGSLRKMSAVSVDLFHSRYRFKDRQGIEGRIIGRYGPKGCRDQGSILVATQVVEQSLDVDFDWLITQLCPADLLFQRIGRLHRHRRDRRPAGFTEPVCTVLLPADGDYGYTGKVYANTRVLWRTEQKLAVDSEGKIRFPAAYREWIEAVYQEGPWPDELESITKAAEKFSDDLFVARCKARQLVTSAMNPFADTDEKVAAITRDGEMALMVIPYIDAGQRRQLLDGEPVAGLDEFQRAEVLALNSIGVPGRWAHWLAEVTEKDEEGRYWLAMDQDEEGFVMARGKVILRYHRATGLERTT
jgi:CRISPR-associated endonuclease/helicase Cas3